MGLLADSLAGGGNRGALQHPDRLCTAVPVIVSYLPVQRKLGHADAQWAGPRRVGPVPAAGVRRQQRARPRGDGRREDRDRDAGRHGPHGHCSADAPQVAAGVAAADAPKSQELGPHLTHLKAQAASAAADAPKSQEVGPHLTHLKSQAATAVTFPKSQAAAAAAAPRGGPGAWVRRGPGCRGAPGR